jgi:hypothetical protein
MLHCRPSCPQPGEAHPDVFDIQASHFPMAGGERFRLVDARKKAWLLERCGVAGKALPNGHF